MQNCYNSNRIPREYMQGQDERLTKKHIETLSFVKEIAEENKVLKQKVEDYELQTQQCAQLHALAQESQERIKTIQEQYLKRADEINAMMAEKQKGEMMLVVEEKLEIERKLTDEITKLKTRIQDLEKTNRELLSKLGNLSDSDERVNLLQMQLDDEKRTNENLKSENDLLRAGIDRLEKQQESNMSTFSNIETIRHQNEALIQEVQELTQKNIELNHRINKLEKEHQDSLNDEDRVTLIENLKIKVTKMQKERAIALEKEQHHEKLIQQLQLELETLRDALNQNEKSKYKLLEEYHKVLKELEDLKKKYSVDSKQKTFKDFVDLKRQLHAVKSENEDLKYNVKIHGSPSLPKLKDTEPSKNPSPRKKSGSLVGNKQFHTLKNA